MIAFVNSAQTEAWVHSLVHELHRPCVVLLVGEMGAGKTQLVRWLMQSLGVRNVTSPTFAIHQSYEVSAGSVDHVDLFRLQSDADLESSGFWDLFDNKNGLVLVEWADRLPDSVWPRSWRQLHIRLEKLNGEERRAHLRIVEAKPR